MIHLQNRRRKLGFIASCGFGILGVFLCSRGIAARGSPETSAAPDASLYRAMKWRLIGPFRGGRVLAVAGVAGQPEVYYFGAVSGGVWKTVDGGQNWTPLFDSEPVSSVGSLAVAPSDPDVIYVGTGEACIRGDISHGDGVYKSLDGGRTWTNVGLKDTQTIGRVLVSPANPNQVFVAALGHVYGPNAERGVFRSLDGGQTWEKVLYKDDRTGAIDLTFDGANPHVLFAALWQASRTPWGLTSGGPGSGLYKSTDDGRTWKQLTGNGLPPGVLGRIGVSASMADPNRVYALIEAEQGGLYRSDDDGDHWQKVNDDHRFRQRAWYFTHVFADPKAPDTVYVLNTGIYRSTDGGKTFTALPSPHADHHGLWIDPANPLRMIEGNDGGATITVDGGRSWSSEENQPTAQFYHVATDNRFPYYVYGAQQDNSTVAIASAGEEGVIGRADWYAVGGGESGYIAPYPPDPNIVYAGSYDGVITRYDRHTGEEQAVDPWPDNPMGSGAADLKYRFQWTFPIVISPHDPGVLYAGAQVLFKSTNGGMSWSVISPDLTRNDKSKQSSSGGPITQDNTSVEYYDTIFSVAESPLQKDLLWVGSDDGLVHLSRDGGKHWADVTPAEMPAWSLVSLIEASPHQAGTAYLAVDRHRLDDLRPYIYKTEDYGRTWTKIVAGIPETSYVHAVREDPRRPGLLYAGTEAEVFVSFDDGGHWQSLKLNMPTTPIHDLAVKDDDLVVATHGRAFWILDDLSPLRQWNPAIKDAAAYLYKPRLAFRTNLRGGFRPRGPAGQNPPDGAVINYFLKTAPREKEEIKLEILDPQGRVIRRYSNQAEPEAERPSEFPGFERRPNRLSAAAGLNRFVWDLRYEPATRVPGAVSWGGRGAGPRVVPGTYRVRLTAAGKTLIEPIEVKLDPRIRTPQADLERQLKLALAIRDRVSEDDQAVNQIRDVRAQLTTLKKRVAAEAKGKDIVAAAGHVDKEMTAVEDELIQTKSKSSEDPLNYPIKLNDKLEALEGVVESAAAAPTEQSYEVFRLLSARLDALLSRWRQIQSQDVQALDGLIRKAGIPPIIVTSGQPGGTNGGYE